MGPITSPLRLLHEVPRFSNQSEHPPLVKLWVGGIVQATGFRLDALHQSNEKEAERPYTERAVFRQNDPDSVQRRARVAMYVLNGLLLLALALALERTFNAGRFPRYTLFLAIDPTVDAQGSIPCATPAWNDASATSVSFRPRA
jgi:hypothetical protein